MGLQLLLSCLLAAITLSNAVADTDDWTLDKMVQLRDADQIAVSPDGKLVAYTVRYPVMDDARSEYLTHIWISATDGSRSFQLTRGKAGCTSPAWSPDGKRLAFLSSRGGGQNIWLINPEIGEARQLTNVPTFAYRFQWSPDGSQIAFLMPEAPDPEESRKRMTGNDARIVDAGAGFTSLYRIAANVGSPDRSDPFKVTGGNLHVAEFDWSPDGKTFVIVHRNSPSMEDLQTADLSLVSADGGEIIPLVRREGNDRWPFFSPDGKTIAFVSDLGEPYIAGYRRFCLISSGGGKVTVLPETCDGQPWRYEWAADGSGFYYSEPKGSGLSVSFTPVNGGDTRLVTTVSSLMAGFDVSDDGSILCFTWENFDAPEELYALKLSPTTRIGQGDRVRISSINDHMPRSPLPTAELISWTSFDGKPIEGILYYPLNYEPGRKYPLVLNVHGGPMEVWTPRYPANIDVYSFGPLAFDGYFVLCANPRGSSGYGRDFRFANVGDWCGDDYKDLMAGVDHVVSTGLVDPDRLGVTGFSYGGLMTAWIITQTDRFKAACMCAGGSTLMPASASNYYYTSTYMGGFFWELPEVYYDQSPINHIAKAVTPTLVLHGEADNASPLHESHQLYYALKHLGVETQMVTYPRTPHGISEPRIGIDYVRRQLEWFSKHLLRH